ncbi:GNAT family N-acetyltransferase [Tenacibaculum sp. MAR_2009_124]|uniref:GNAT family N-acetyltransferase n=1 Tax=Tenacibaculum sp. MAR_2009_124 TaxID=1250059 RepID=UPI000B805241|nr:GNAT family N-acetyltransferase [Tenacibaculum sp. MAR_2009_124]
MKYILKNQETKRILFKEVSLLQFNDWLEFHKNPLTSIHWQSELESPDSECKKWYEKQFYRYENDLGGMNALIEKQSGKLIGYCGLLIQTVDEKKELEIGYSLLPKFWKKGLASEAALKCRDFAFENDLTDSIISIISLTNKPSEKVAIKNGMTIDKRTMYHGNEVNIFRISKSQWQKLNNL